MTVIHVLKESTRLLFKRPKIFIPNMSVALIYAAFELILIKLFMDIINEIMFASPSEFHDILFSNLIPIVGILAFYPILGAMDLITYSMYPSLVSDYHEGRDISLWLALKSSLGSWRVWLTLGLVLLLFLIFVVPIVMIPVMIYLLTENIFFIFLAFFIFITALILLMMAVFFVIPIGVIENEKPIESFKRSYQLAIRYRVEVFSLITMFIIIIIIAFALGNIHGIGLCTEITYFAIAIFILIKIIQSLIYTYICVVNPYFYVHFKNRGIKQ